MGHECRAGRWGAAGGGAWGPLSPQSPSIPASDQRNMNILNSNLTFQVIVKMSFSRQKAGTFNNFVSLLSSCKIRKRMACGPPFVFMLWIPANTRDLMLRDAPLERNLSELFFLQNPAKGFPRLCLWI